MTRLPPEIYDREYFLSAKCEGFDSFEVGELSAVKLVEFEHLRLTPGLHVLDAGCGRGDMLKECAKAGARVAGIDYSEASVALTQETLASVEGADIRRGDITALPWPDDTFDRVLFADVIEHLDPSDAAEALAEFRRVLRPGGTLLVHTAPNRLFRKVSWPVLRPFVRLAAPTAASELDSFLAAALEYHVNEQTLRGLRRSVHAAGFDRVEAWIDQNVLRSGAHPLTRGLERNMLARMAAATARLRPVRAFLGNDLYVRSTKPTSA